MTLDILACYRTPPKPREYVLPGLLPGTVGSIVSPGGQGKSILALMLAHYVASGIDLLDLGAIHTGKTAYLSAEDGGDILHERLHEIGKHLSDVQQETCAEAITVEDLTATPPDLLNHDAEKWRASLEANASGARLLFLDTLRSFHSGDENDSRAMSVLIGHIRAIAARTRCAIVFLHHSSKALAVSGQGDTQQAARGSSVLTDNIRWQAYLVGMTDDESKRLSDRMDGQAIGEEKRLFVRFGISKQNYGVPFNEKWFRRGQGGIFEAANLSPASYKTSEQSDQKTTTEDWKAGERVTDGF
jgi:RecA-family ATPase